MVWSYSLFLTKQIITPYRAAQKVITKDQQTLVTNLQDGHSYIGVITNTSLIPQPIVRIDVTHV
ncbi:hypothetical protein EAY19_19980 [Vibrio anguillarum]|nr:hypothetical protein [Vibrio anguillarum]